MLYSWCENYGFTTSSKQKEEWDMKQFTSCWLPLNIVSKLTSCALHTKMGIVDTRTFTSNKSEAYECILVKLCTPSLIKVLNTEIDLHAVLMMWELWIDNIIKEKEVRDMKRFTTLLIIIAHWNTLTGCIEDVGIVDSQYHQRKWSIRYETVHKLLITIEHWSKLTCCIDDVENCGFTISSKKRKREIWNRSQVTDYHWTLKVNLPAVLMMRELRIHNIIKEKEEWDMKQFTSYWLPLNTEVNLPAVLMMWELWIHNIIKQKEAWDMKQFTSYWLPLNTEVNLPPVLMMWELWIHNIIKQKEARDMKQFTSYWLPLNTEVNLPAVLMMWELWIHNIIKQKEVRDMKQFTSYWLPLNTEVNLPAVLMMWGIVDSQYHQRKETRYEAVQKWLITIEHWR